MWGKPYISNVENEFKTSRMRDKHVFHDISLRVDDPEEFRVTAVNYLRSLGFIIDLNEMTEFEEGDEFVKFFRGGRLKPLKNIIKARRSTVVGSRFPVLWKSLFIVGLASLIAYFLPYKELNKELLFYSTIVSFLLSALFLLIKREIISSVWVKIIGVYDVEGMKADLRVVISADVSEGNFKVFNDLRDDVAEFYDLVTHKYLKKVKPAETLIKPTAKSKSEELVERLVKVNKDMKVLRDKFINGRVSEDIFRRLMNSLDKEKDKIETVLDLLTS